MKSVYLFHDLFHDYSIHSGEVWDTISRAIFESTWLLGSLAEEVAERLGAVY